MDWHQQKQFDLDLARLNMLTYETATNRVCQQHQRSLRTEVPRCPHVRGLEYFCNEIHKNMDPDDLQFVQMRKALPSSLKPNKDFWDLTASILDIQRERRWEGKRLTRFIMNTLSEAWSESHTPSRITLTTCQVIWEDAVFDIRTLEHDLNRLKDEIWLESVQLSSS